MKARELRRKTISELRQEERTLRQQEFELRFQHATGRLDKTAGLKSKRRDIARVKTIIAEKEASK